jgi:hypothetical protein
MEEVDMRMGLAGCALIAALMMVPGAHAGDWVACRIANSRPEINPHLPLHAAEALRLKDLARIEAAKPRCEALKREEAARREAERQRHEAKQRAEEKRMQEIAEHSRREAERRRAEAEEMRKPINRLRFAYWNYMNVSACYRERQGYFLVLINDIQMKRARDAVSRIEQDVLKEDPTISTERSGGMSTRERHPLSPSTNARWLMTR